VPFLYSVTVPVTKEDHILLQPMSGHQRAAFHGTVCCTQPGVGSSLALRALSDMFVPRDDIGSLRQRSN
jgi:hypothetical protein